MHGSQAGRMTKEKNIQFHQCLMIWQLQYGNLPLSPKVKNQRTLPKLVQFWNFEYQFKDMTYNNVLTQGKFG